MTIKLGPTNINKVFLGSVEVRKVFLGSTLIHDTTGGGGGGGASGNFTFAVEQFREETGPSAPGVVTPLGPITAGNFLFLVCAERSGEVPATHAVTDSNGKTWTRVPDLDYDNAVVGNEANTRMTFSVWTRVVDATGETDPTPSIECAIGASTVYMLLLEISSSGPYGWIYAAGSVDGSGASDWSGQTSGAANAVGDDIFEIAVGVCRNDGSNEPSTGNVSFATQTDGATEYIGGPNQMTIFVSFEAVSQAAGSKSATITSDGSGNEGVAAVACWRAV